MGKAQFRVVGDTAIGSILFKGMLVEFLIDAADLEAVKAHRWHYTANNYIATSVRSVQPAQQNQVQADLSGSAAAATEPKKRELYLHTLLLSPSPDQVVQHITKNGLDNRRRNLRLVPAATAASAAQAKKKRNIELPPMCGVKPEEIPKHIWYVQANGYHRDRFAIELKSEGILWKTTSSKTVSLQEKLAQAKAKLEALYIQYPYLDPKKEEDLVADLTSSCESLLKDSAQPQASPLPPLKG